MNSDLQSGARTPPNSDLAKPGAERTSDPRTKQPRLTLEGEKDLRQFLKHVCGEKWSKPRKHGFNDIQSVVEKLEAIGVYDVGELLHRVTTRTINEDLAREGFPRFSRDTLDSIRNKSAFIRALEHLNETQYRQIGVFAPVPQMLSCTNLRYQATKGAGGGNKASMSFARPASTPAGHERGDSGSVSPNASSRLPASRSEAALHGHLDEFEWRPSLRHAKSKRKIVQPDSEMPYPMTPVASLANRTGDFVAQGWEASVTKTPTLPKSPGDVVPSTPGRSRFHTEQHASRPRVLSGDSGHTPGGSPSPQRPPTISSVPETPARSHNRDRLMTAPDRLITAPKGGETPRVLAKLQQASQQIREEHRTASWTSLNATSDSLVTHGEAMLREQKNLEDRRVIGRVMLGEGTVSPLRQHVVKNIRSRLKEERERDDQLTLDQVEIQQRGINISKHLNEMLKKRRELQMLKRTAFEEETTKPQAETFSLEVFQRSESHGQLEPLPAGHKGGKRASFMSKG